MSLADPEDRGPGRWGERLPLATGVLLVLVGAALVAGLILLPPPRGTAVASPSPGGLLTAAPSPSVAPSVAPTSIPTAPLTATPAPTPRQIASTGVDLTWRPIVTLPGTAANPDTQTVLVNGLAHGPAGYVAAGEIVDGYLTETGATGPIHAAIWTSTDALTWRLADASAFGAGIPQDLASDGRTVVALAAGEQGTTLLRSTDGATWASVEPDDARVVRVIRGGPGFVALGARISTNHAAIWTSADGATWVRRWESDVAAGEELTALAAAPDGRLLAGGLQIRTSGVRAVAVVSDDGAAWRRVAAASLPATAGFDAVGIGADGAWYAAGYDQARGGIGIWRSTDGTAWVATPFSPALSTEVPGDTGSASEIVSFDGATFVLAFTSCCGDPPQRTFVRRGAGAWARASRATFMRDVHLRAMLVEADRVVAVGALNRTAGVWLATAAPRDGVELITDPAPLGQSAACGAPSHVEVRLEADRSGPVVRVRLVRLDREGVEFGPVVWPNGWTAAKGPPLVILDAAGTTVAREGDTLVLDDGAVAGGAYRICRLDGVARYGSGP